MSKIRRTIKGELLLELNGAIKKNTAQLKNEISQALGFQSGLLWEACLEIKGLDCLATRDDIAVAIAAVVGIPNVDTRVVKSLRPSYAGTQLVIVCLPPLQAKASLEVCKLKIGWTRCLIHERTTQRRC